LVKRFDLSSLSLSPTLSTFFDDDVVVICNDGGWRDKLLKKIQKTWGMEQSS
jgi:hypothetical protein